MAAGHWGGDGSVMNNPLEAPSSTMLYLCLPPIEGSEGGDCYFPTTSGHIWKLLINTNPFSTCTHCTVTPVQYHLAKILVAHLRWLESPENLGKLSKK